MAIIVEDPYFLWFLLTLPILFIVHIATVKTNRAKALKFANFDAIARVTGKQVFSRNFTLLFFRLLAITFIIFALSGTKLSYVGQSNESDFVIAIDASASMAAKDFTPSRLAAARAQALNFVDRLQPGTQVGIISFSGTSEVIIQPTDDLGRAKRKIEDVVIREIGGTDLGEAITTATSMILPSKKAKTIILLTDGQGNVGIPLKEATQYATNEGVTIHTIGIGTTEGGAFAGLDIVSTIDEDSLKEIAQASGGKYFPAQTERELAEAYQEIAATTKGNITKDLTVSLIGLALAILIVEWLLANTRFRTLP
ncbi:VWA domain-containing protein [Candidatus Woesearchaeota archaeon]|nr:VWA domain-containing protein [Candidatus Woesearchaeota archaeon]